MKPEHATIGSTDDEEIVLAELDHETVTAEKVTKGSLFERLLSPESLQWMMACGSGLLVLGFVAWLWSTGVFEQPLVVASVCGTATMAFIGAGIAMVVKTRHQLAGRWLTLVGALAMPLNLWLYDAQGLITLADGGHLWIPAALCCVVYAGIARVLRDSAFVYALVGGIVLTGMLFLADQTVGRLWHWLPPAQFLVVNGWICMFAERLFTDNEKSDFSRNKFGFAFFRAGLGVVVCGLGLLLGGYVSALGSSFFASNFWPLTQIAVEQKVWSLILVGGSAIGFFVQGVLRKSRVLLGAGIALVVCGALIGVNLLSISITATLAAIVAASLVIVRNLIMGLMLRKADDSNAGDDRAGNTGPQLVVGFLTLLAFGQMIFHFEALIDSAPVLTWWKVVQFALTSVAAWTLAWSVRLTKQGSGNENKFVAGCVTIGGIVAMFAIWGAIALQSVFAMPLLAVAAAIVPLGLMLIGLFGPQNSQTSGVSSAAQHVGTAMMSTHLATLAACIFHPALAIASTHPVWIVALGIASLVYGLASRSLWPTTNKVLSLASAIGGIAVSGHYLGFGFANCLVLAPALIGTGIKLLYFFVGESSDTVGAKRKNPLVTAANVIILQAGVASVLLSGSRWLSGDVSGTLLIVMLTIFSCTVISSVVTRDDYWRSVFRGLIVAIVSSSLCVLDGLLNLDGWLRGEVCSLVGGSVLLVLGHLAWIRENDKDADTVATVSLFAGSLLIVVPLAIGIVVCRLGGLDGSHWPLFHEIATVAGGLGLLAAGILCRVRSTTIAGATLMTVFIGSLVTLIRISSQLQSASVVMMVGGGAFLAFAIMMSIYRDRLVAIPKQIADGEGIFQVLKWR